MRFKLFVLAAVALLIAIAPLAAQDVTPLKIGILTDQSGALALYGQELVNGFELGLLYAAGIDPSAAESLEAALAELTLGGRPVEILIRDNGSDAEVAAQQARELIEQEGVEILVGAPSSGVTLGLQQVALDYDTILFAAPGASPNITGAGFNLNTFRVCRNTAQDSLALASFAPELGENWAILAADYDFGRASADAFKATLGAYGITFPTDVIYAPLETTDFTSYLQQVKDSGADVLLPIWAGDTTVALFQQIKELGVLDEMAVVGAINSNNIMQVSDPSTIGSVLYGVYHYTFPQTETNDWLVAQHSALFTLADGTTPDYPDLFTECAFATAQALSLAVTATEGDTLPEAMIPALEGLLFDGPKGLYAIRPADHQVMVPMYVGRLTNLDSPEFAFYELLGEVSMIDTNPPCLLPEAFVDRCATIGAFVTDVVTPALEERMAAME